MNLPTRAFCFKLTIDRPDAFYRNKYEVNGYNVEVYGYRFASDSDFETYDAYELRGITFVLDPETEEWNRHLALRKFFNVNQCEGWHFDQLKDQEVMNVQNKLDGSLITFVRFPDGTIRAKSKMSFDSEQAQGAQAIFENNKGINEFVRNCLYNYHSPIFEFISPSNQIVIVYDKTELVLLQVRDHVGNYYLSDELKEISYVYGFPTAEIHEYTLDEIMEFKKTHEGYEGYVITFPDKMAKVKLDAYLALHGVITELREDNVIELIVNEELDDVLSIYTGERLEFIKKVEEITNHKANKLIKEFKELRWAYFNAYNEDRKKFAIDNKDLPLFSSVMRTINESFRDVNEIAKDKVKEYILLKTNSLTKAKEWLYAI